MGFTVCWNLFLTPPRQLLSNLPGSMSIHFRSRYGTDTRDNVEFDVCCGLAFATSFPILFSPTLSTWVSSDVSVTHYLIPFTILTQEQVLCTITSRTGPIFVFPRIRPFNWDDGSLRGKGVFSTWSFQSVKFFVIKWNVLWKICELLLVFTHKRFPFSPASVWEVWFVVDTSGGFTMVSRFSGATGFPYPLNFWRFPRPNLHTYPLLLRRYWADWRKSLNEESLRRSRRCHWNVWTIFLFLCSPNLPFQKHWILEKRDVRLHWN